MSDWLIGQVVRLSVTIADAAGVAGDPGVLRLKTKAPNGTITTYTYGTGEIVKDAVGKYHADVQMGAVGTWVYRWESDAPALGANEGTLTVRKSAI